MPNDELAGCIERIDQLLAKLDSLADIPLREDVQEVVQCLLTYHGAAVARLLSELSHAAGPPREIVARLAQDELVGSLLLLHGLHPADLETRVGAALDRVRPFLQSHGGNVELAQIAGGVVHVRLAGHCHGCPSSAATMKSQIEQAIFAAAPDVESVVMDEEAPPAATPAAAGGFVALENLALG
ncbi:MAG: NifU family protein [Pirellulales bacterium]